LHLGQEMDSIKKYKKRPLEAGEDGGMWFGSVRKMEINEVKTWPGGKAEERYSARGKSRAAFKVEIEDNSISQKKTKG